MAMNLWDKWIGEAFSILESKGTIGFIRTIHLPSVEQQQQNTNQIHGNGKNNGFCPEDEFEFFEGLHEWDRAAVEVEISQSTFQKWIQGLPDTGGDAGCDNRTVAGDGSPGEFRKLLLFSGNNYLCLSSHPAVTKASSKAALAYGMGPRGSALACGYTTYHSLLESCLAELKKKEDCLLCPTGYAANVALMTAIGTVGSLLAARTSKTIPVEEKVAIFSDAFNHASIIDGMRLVQQQGSGEVFVYGHCDMSHLNELLSSCPMKKKVVVTDSVFSMDGDVAPMGELVKLRKRHGFLLVIDDAHGTFVFGKNGGGVAEELNCESDVDICVGTLSKAAGCLGGFIACSKSWKRLIQSRGRSFIFSTSLPVPIAAAAYAAVIVGKKETWRRKVIWERLKDFQALTGIPVTSPIISVVVGSEEKAHQAGRDLLKCGFHVIPVTPPVVPPNSCRLRVSLCVGHTLDDLKKLTAKLSEYVNFQDIGHSS